jgi:hypothetical protein
VQKHDRILLGALTTRSSGYLTDRARLPATSSRSSYFMTTKGGSLVAMNERRFRGVAELDGHADSHMATPCLPRCHFNAPSTPHRSTKPRFTVAQCTRPRFLSLSMSLTVAHLVPATELRWRTTTKLAAAVAATATASTVMSTRSSPTAPAARLARVCRRVHRRPHSDGGAAARRVHRAALGSAAAGAA